MSADDQEAKEVIANAAIIAKEFIGLGASSALGTAVTMLGMLIAYYADGSDLKRSRLILDAVGLLQKAPRENVLSEMLERDNPQ